MTDSKQQAITWLLENWTGRLAQVLESMSGERSRVTWRQSEEPVPSIQGPPSDSGAMLWWEQSLSLAPEAALWVGAPEEAWREIGGFTLRAAGPDHAEDAETKSTYLEILGQTLSNLAHSIGVRLSSPVGCKEGKEVSEPPEVFPWYKVEVGLGQSSPLSVVIVFSELLLGQVDPQSAGSGTELRPETAGATGETAGPSQGAKTLDLLMEVELPVSVSFGRAELPLKDVLKLTTGSIVELNRTVTEPVEVIVNNCVIARGEVVVVEGNYGVRIQEILTPQERLRTLK